MNSRQRVLRLLRGEEVDRLPRGEVALEEEFVRDLLGFRRRRNVIGWLEQRAAVAALDLDLITVDAATGAQGLAQDVDRARLKRANDWRDSGLAVVVRVDGPLNRLVMALGIEAAAARLDRRRTKPFATLDLVAARLRGAVGRAAAAGATALLVADDCPDLADLPVPIEHLHRFYLPQLAELVNTARSYRLPVMVHVAAWHWPLLDDLCRLKPAALQGLSGRPLAEFRERAGPEICLWGNADPAWLAQPHAPEEVLDEARRLIAAGRPRYLFGTASGLRAGLDPEVVLLLYEAASRAPRL